MVEVRPGPACNQIECEGPSGVIRLRPAGDEGTADTAVARTLGAWGPLALPLPAGPGLVLEVDDPRYWTPILVRSRESREIALRLHPVTDVRVEVQSRTDGRPRDLRVAFSSTPEEVVPQGSEAARSRAASSLNGELPCEPTEESTVWQCRIPSGSMDLHFQARGFASEFRWSVPLEPFQRATLAPLDLVPGSSLLGWLETPPDAELEEAVEVELVPAGEMGGATGVRSLARTAAVSERGLFQFRDLPAGVYRLRVDVPGWARTEVGPLEVVSGLETRLADPVPLRRPGHLTVCVEPPVPPGVRRLEDTWTLSLDPRDGRSFSSRETVDLLGCARFADLQPGMYGLALGDRRGSRWDRREAEIRSGEQRVEIRVEYYPIEGTLTHDSEPLRALLEFRRGTPRDGDGEERKVDWFVDPEGHFEGALTEPGTWYVWATLRGGRKIELGPVEIEDDPGELQTITLELPATRLEGRVLDAEGRPAESAAVWLSRKGTPEPGRPGGFSGEVETNSEGRYAFEGIAPGEYYVTAHRGPAWASAEAVVTEDVSEPGPTLYLEATKEVRGLVLGSHGAIPGAQVYVLPEPGDVPFRAVSPRYTDAQGEFQISVPEGSTAIRVLALAVGYGARAMRFPLGEGSGPNFISLERLTGTLRLTADPSAPLPYGRDLWMNGIPMALSHFAGWARSVGGSLAAEGWVLPGMAPGAYRLCDRLQERCDDGFLGAGQVLDLEVAGGGRPDDAEPAER